MRYKNVNLSIMLLTLALITGLILTLGISPAFAALGASYTSQVQASSSYPDTNGTELTDGVYAPTDSLYTHAAWQG